MSTDELAGGDDPARMTNGRRAGGGGGPPPRLYPVGLTAVLVEIGSTGEAGALYRHLVRLRAGGSLTGVIDLVRGARTVLDDGVTAAPDLAALRSLCAGWDPAAAGADPTATVEIPVRYGGADLGEVARLTGLAPAEVIAAHTGQLLRTEFCGFLPGFAYIGGLPAALHVPRRADPRTAVPAGSVALAGGYTAVYPRASPGGWHLIGRTDVVVWDPHRDPPALLPPGTPVRFR